jgi:hypothetical protein
MRIYSNEVEWCVTTGKVTEDKISITISRGRWICGQWKASQTWNGAVPAEAINLDNPTGFNRQPFKSPTKEDYISAYPEACEAQQYIDSIAWDSIEITAFDHAGYRKESPDGMGTRIVGSGNGHLAHLPEDLFIQIVAERVGGGYKLITPINKAESLALTEWHKVNNIPTFEQYCQTLGLVHEAGQREAERQAKNNWLLQFVEQWKDLLGTPG